jgi:hypothetical protein
MAWAPQQSIGTVRMVPTCADVPTVPTVPLLTLVFL